METFEIVAKQTPGIIEFSNYESVKSALMEYVRDNYEDVDYSAEGIEIAKSDRDEIKKHEDSIKKKKKELSEAYSAPYAEVEKKLDELISMLDEPYKRAKKYVDEMEKTEKLARAEEYAKMKSSILGDAANKVITSKAFRNPKWDQKGYTDKKIQDEIDERIASAVKDISVIQSAGGENTSVMLARYYETLTMDGMDEFLENAKSNTVDVDYTAIESEKNIRGYKVLRITATEDQMAFLMSQLELMDVDVEEIEDGMPKPMQEVLNPSFDSFVAFDIETTGTNGAANGDEEAKITEIGAVRVENGVVVEKFDELANPGRKIVPRIARMTHISDEMVADKPPVDVVIKRFKDFVGDTVLVGHNIKSSDLRYIIKAADKAGVNFENPFLDTYILAKQFKMDKGWESTKLSYLSKYFGFEHKEAHRAWSDAEVNVQVYFELKRMNEEMALGTNDGIDGKAQANR